MATLDVQRAWLAGLLGWVRRCNDGAAALESGAFAPFLVDGQVLGYLKPR